MTLNRLGRFGLALVAALVFAAPSAELAFAQSSPTPITRSSNVRHFPAQQVTAGQTFAVTAYADLAGSLTTFVPVRNPGTYTTPGTAATQNQLPRIEVTASLDVSKATGTTGSCAVFVNGAIVPASERFSSFSAGRNTVSLLWFGLNTVTGSQVVKVQCHSADTSVFTVSTGQVTVKEIY